MVTSTEILVALGVEGVQESRRGIESVADAVERLRKEQGPATTQSAKYDQSLRDVGQGALLAGGGLLAGFGTAVYASANFDQALSGVAAVSSATAEEMGLLRQAALDAGQATVFSASEAATAEAELAKAGVSTSDILGGALTGSLNLAAAGQLDLATAATISGQALNIFNLEGSQTGHVADLLAAGANKSAADVQQLGDALAQGGLVAKGANLSIEETVGTLALFADNALVGSDAGTSLKAMLLALQGPSDKSADLMAELGLNVYDASGQFIGMEGLAGQLQDRLGGLTQAEQDYALAQIFGNDAVRAARALMDEGADGVRDYTDAVNDQGAAQRMASVQLDNLAGDLEQLKGSLETALIETGSHANGALRGLTQSATGLVNEFAQAPGWLQGTALGLAGVGGSSLVAVGMVGSLIPKVKEVKAAFTALPAGAQAGMLGLTAATAAGAVVLAHWAKEKEEARQRTQAFVDLIRQDESLMRSDTQATLANDLAKKNLGDDLGKLNGHLTSGRPAIEVWTDALNGSAASAQELRAAMLDAGLFEFDFGGTTRSAEELRDEFVLLGDEAVGSQKSIEFFTAGNVDLYYELRNVTEAAADARSQIAASEGATRSAADVTHELTLATGDLRDMVAAGTTTGEDYAAAKKKVADLTAEQARGEEAVQDAIGNTTETVEDATSALDEYKQRLDDLIGLPLSLESASLSWTESLMGLTESVTENGLTLDANTEKGIANRRSIMDSVDAAKDHAEAVLDQGGSIEWANAVLQSHRTDLENTLVMMGLSREEAGRYIDQLGLIPDNVRTAVEMDVTAHVSTLYTANEHQGHRAAGGPVRAGASYVVGEHRPELFVPDSDGYILPAVPEFAGPRSTLSTSGGAAPVIVNLDLRGSVGLDPERLGREVYSALKLLEQDVGPLDLRVRAS